MDPAPITGFSHIQLLVRDLGVSEGWYSTVLGLERIAAGDGEGPEGRYVALRHPPSRQVIVLTAAPDGLDGRESRLDHLAFAVSSDAALREWAARLTELGIEHAGVAPEGRHAHSVHLRDPDGIAIELAAAPPREATPDNG